MVDEIRTCERCESPVEEGDLRCAICGQTVPAATQRRTEVQVQILRCEGCGAAVEYDASVQAPRCAFCDSVMHLEELVDPMEQTELFLPFTIGGEEARGAVKAWLGSLGWFRPPDLKQRASVEGVRPLWWVGWAFDADALVSWTADSNAGSHRAAWAPHSGQARLRFDDIVVSASRGLTDEEVAAVVPHYSLAGAAAESTPPEGVTAEQFDVQRSQARARVVHAVERMSAKVIEEEHVPGSSFRKVQVAPLLRSLVTHRYSFPAWVMAYRYEEKVYRAVVCGQNAECVIGKAPYSVPRILLAVFGGIAALVVLAVVIAAIVAAS